MEDKKVVTILLGSPRAGGNTETLAEALARGAEENGCEVRRVRLQGKKLNGCLDCRRRARHACRRTTWAKSTKR